MKALRALSGTLLLSGLMSACSSLPAGAREERSGRVVLHSTEIQTSGYGDLFTAIRALRPNWLRLQGATSFGGQEEIVVYLDGNRMGGVAVLRDIPTRSVSSVRFLTGLEATQRWGLDHGMGAILVSTHEPRN